MRLVIEALVGLNALASLGGLVWRRQRRQGQQRDLAAGQAAHDEYQAQLRAQNDAIDKEFERIKKGTG